MPVFGCRVLGGGGALDGGALVVALGRGRVVKTVVVPGGAGLDGEDAGVSTPHAVNSVNPIATTRPSRRRTAPTVPHT